MCAGCACRAGGGKGGGVATSRILAPCCVRLCAVALEGPGARAGRGTLAEGWWAMCTQTEQMASWCTACWSFSRAAGKTKSRVLSGSRGQGAADPTFSCEIMLIPQQAVREHSTPQEGGVRPTDFVTTNRSCLSFLVYTSALWRVATAAFQSRALCAASMGAATGAVSLPTLPPGAPCGRLRTWACGCTASV